MNKVERFRGPTPAVAMRKARTALGDDAKLMSARRLPGRGGEAPVYEVSVAPAPSSPPPSDASLGELKREVTELRQRLAAITSSVDPEGAAEADPALSSWVDLLRRQGVGRSAAELLVRRASVQAGTRLAPGEALDHVLAAELGTGSSPEPPGERSAIFVGPTGGGKTTAVAKLAAELVRRGRRPLLVTTDGESFAGEENLASVAAALGLELRRAFLAGQLAEIVEGLPAGRLVLVDTPGCSLAEPGALEKLRPILRSLPDSDVLLVIPAATDREEALAIVEGYRTLGECRIVLSKLDELCRPGRIVDLARAVTQPIAWVTFGRGVHGTCSTPDDPAVVMRILGSARTLVASA